MYTYTPTTEFVVPPVCQGQMIEISYALDAENEVIIERSIDRSEPKCEPTYMAYEYPDESFHGDWTPWNDVPDTGDCIGQCLIA